MFKYTVVSITVKMTLSDKQRDALIKHDELSEKLGSSPLYDLIEMFGAWDMSCDHPFESSIYFTAANRHHADSVCVFIESILGKV